MNDLSTRRDPAFAGHLDRETQRYHIIGIAGTSPAMACLYALLIYVLLIYALLIQNGRNPQHNFKHRLCAAGAHAMPKMHTERSHCTVEIPGAWFRCDDAGFRPVTLQTARVWQSGLAAVAISLGVLSADAAALDRTGHFAQSAIDAPGAPTRPAPVAGAANSREQIMKAQTELRRLDCLSGRIDGKLGDRTREAVQKFWAMARQPAVGVNITDELISRLAEHGDNFCRPPRRFFGFGGHALPPLFAPGARPGLVPAAVQPPSPGGEPHQE